MYNETSETCVIDLKRTCHTTCAQDSVARKYLYFTREPEISVTKLCGHVPFNYLFISKIICDITKEFAFMIF